MTDQKESSAHVLLEMVENNKKKFKDDEYKKMVDTIVKLRDEYKVPELYLIKYITHYVSFDTCPECDEATPELKSYEESSIIRIGEYPHRIPHKNQWQCKKLTQEKFEQWKKDKTFYIDHATRLILISYQKI